MSNQLAILNLYFTISIGRSNQSFKDCLFIFGNQFYDALQGFLGRLTMLKDRLSGSLGEPYFILVAVVNSDLIMLVS